MTTQWRWRWRIILLSGCIGVRMCCNVPWGHVCILLCMYLQDMICFCFHDMYNQSPPVFIASWLDCALIAQCTVPQCTWLFLTMMKLTDCWTSGWKGSLDFKWTILQGKSIKSFSGTAEAFRLTRWWVMMRRRRRKRRSRKRRRRQSKQRFRRRLLRRRERRGKGKLIGRSVGKSVARIAGRHWQLQWCTWTVPAGATLRLTWKKHFEWVNCGMKSRRAVVGKAWSRAAAARAAREARKLCYWTTTGQSCMQSCQQYILTCIEWGAGSLKWVEKMSGELHTMTGF